MEALGTRLIANQELGRLVKLIDVQNKLIELYKEKCEILVKENEGLGALVDPVELERWIQKGSKEEGK